ncbi:hypothetical protein C0583_01850 [Candidatus Parcubacteria bacterium]|nr:MAG: hypothetical protein C0583_01850 [Candidatus Parcubacteria bacterium]
MNNFSYAVISGLCFGLWPLFVNKSLLSGFVSAFFICLVSIIIFFPMAWSSLGEIRNANISMVLVGSVLSAIGIVFLTLMLANTKDKEVSIIFIIMICFQIAVPAIYHIYLEGGISLNKVIGFIGLIVTVVFLQK